jgi:hypothetical protein
MRKSMLAIIAGAAAATLMLSPDLASARGGGFGGGGFGEKLFELAQAAPNFGRHMN